MRHSIIDAKIVVISRSKFSKRMTQKEKTDANSKKVEEQQCDVDMATMKVLDVLFVKIVKIDEIYSKESTSARDKVAEHRVEKVKSFQVLKQK